MRTSDTKMRHFQETKQSIKIELYIQFDNPIVKNQSAYITYVETLRATSQTCEKRLIHAKSHDYSVFKMPS